MRTVVLSIVLALSINLGWADLKQEGSTSPRFLVHLLDYLAKDYPGAIKDGKILNQFEYDEQIEFAKEVIKLSSTLESTKDNEELNSQVKVLESLILNKAEPKKVSSLARALQQTVLETSELKISPSHWPNLSNGKLIYAQNCASCHGASGNGMGPAVSEAMDPKPANFLDGGMATVSPFQTFNTVRLGIPGTSMVSMNHLNDKEIWDVAFYTVSLRHKNKATEEVIKKLHSVQNNTNPDLLKTIATTSDENLAYDDETLAALRLYSPNGTPGGSLNVATKNLDLALESFKAGDPDQAKKHALIAYLDGIEPAEPKLKANDADLTITLEEQMGAVRALIEKRSTVPELESAVATAKGTIGKAETILSGSKNSPLMAFLLAVGILLREGFEAILLIIVLLGVVRATKSQKAAIWVHSGWALAVLIGIAAWFFSGWLMKLSGAGREILEGTTSILAVGILLYFGFWLHNKTEMHRWRAFLDGKIKKALDGGNLFVLALVSFVAVFREAFESVLFLRAVLLGSGPEAGTYVGAAVGISMVALVFIAWILVKFSARLPVRKLFEYSSIVLIVLAVILTGKGFHSLQESGLIPITSWPSLMRIDIMGIYPTLETILPQALTLLLSIGLWMYGKRTPKRVKESMA